MKDVILIGRQEKITEVPAQAWRKHLSHAQQHSEARLAFMTPDHHRVRNLTVSELPSNHGKPLSAEGISRQVQLPLSRVITILHDLQNHLFFLVLNPAGEVSWAFPVTSERTAHLLHFSTGEKLFAA